MKNKMQVFGIALAGLFVLGSCAKESAIDSTTAKTGDFTPIKLEMSLEADRLLSSPNQFRGLDYKLTNTADGKIAQPKLDYSNGKNQQFKSIGIFYAPSGAAGKKFFSAELTWDRRDDQEVDENGANVTMVRYVCNTNVETIAQSAGVDVAALKGQTWYMANVIGAKLDVATKKLIVDPYGEGATGWGVQEIGDLNLDAPMVSQWIPVQIKEVTYHTGLLVTSDVRSQFKPLGALLRLDVTSNVANYNLKMKGASIYSNYLKGAASFAYDETSLGAINAADLTGSKDLSLTPQDSKVGARPTLTFGSAATLARGESLVDNKNRVLLMWGMPSSVTIDASKAFISVEVDADLERTDGTVVYNTADKRADYVREDYRVSLFMQKPVITFTFARGKELIKSGETGYAKAVLEDRSFSMFNLERMVFENVNPTGTTFRSNHPYVNWHIQTETNWLDYTNAHSPNNSRRVVANFRPTAPNGDPYFEEVGYPINRTSQATYYIPSRAQVRSFLPVDATGRFTMPEAGEIVNISTTVQEENINTKNARSKNDVANAKFRIKGGDASKVELYTENGKVPFNWSHIALRNIRPRHHYLNFNPTSRVGYALALLDENDPKSLVAYRYSWGVSPCLDYLVDRFRSNPAVNNAQNNLWAEGRDVISFMMIAMIPIDEKSPIKSLDDIDMVAHENFWVPLAQKKALVTRLLLATGHYRVGNASSLDSNPSGYRTNVSDAWREGRSGSLSANAGSYILTRDYDTSPNTDSYYFVIDGTGWSELKMDNDPYGKTPGGARTAQSSVSAIVVHPFVGTDPN